MAFACGKGTVIQIEDTTFKTIPQTVSITPPTVEMGSVETTHMASTARNHKSTIVDSGEVSFQLEYDPADVLHVLLWTKFQAGTVENWKIILTDTGATEVDFSAFVMNFGIEELTVDNLAVVPVTLKIDGAVTITTT